MESTDKQRLAEIEQRLDHATPGPWRWFGNVDTHTLYLATAKWGRQIVMDFRRWGMNGAQPEFVDGRAWVPGDNGEPDFVSGGRIVAAATRPVFEVERDAISRQDPRVYRGDLVGIRNGDAELLAHAGADLDWAIVRIKQLEEQLAPFQSAPIEKVQA
jgi:hypothetical protein